MLKSDDGFRVGLQHKSPAPSTRRGEGVKINHPLSSAELDTHASRHLFRTHRGIAMSTRRVYIPWSPREEERLLPWMEENRHLSWQQRELRYQVYKRQTANSLRSKCRELRSGQRRRSRVRQCVIPRRHETYLFPNQTEDNIKIPFVCKAQNSTESSASPGSASLSVSATSPKSSSVPSSRLPSPSFRSYCQHTSYQGNRLTGSTCQSLPDMRHVDWQLLCLPRLPSATHATVFSTHRIPSGLLGAGSRFRESVRKGESRLDMHPGNLEQLGAIRLPFPAQK
jgi:hypothetical protein